MKKTNQKTPDISLPTYYNNRELSWLAFNERVLEEAQDDSNPLLERFKFLAIFSSNLDEFFMVRVAGLKDQIKIGFTKPEDKSGLTPKQQVDEITKKTTGLVTTQYAVYHKILHALHHEHIKIARIQDINETQYAYLEQLFEHTLLPILTPMAVDTYHPFPKLLNKRINLAVFLSRKNDPKQERLLAIVQVPALFSRFIQLPAAQDKHIFILLEDVLCHFMYKLFTGYDILSVSEFRITRNTDLTIDEEDAQDFLREIEKELKKRELGAAVRLEIRENEVDHTLLPYLLNALGIEQKDVYAVSGPLDLTFLFAFYNQLADTKEHLIYEKFTPQPTQDFLESHNVFAVIEKQDVLLHHPYESFQPVIDFLCQAADDPGVMAIKQTLYRVSGNSPIIKALKRAAENGKQVTVLLELKARFDEENNVHWAKELEEVGCHVIYGMNRLKTHSKITLVVRHKEGKIQRFVHLGTGNYNDVTAKIYTDVGFFTSHPEFGKDATDFFNYLSGYCEKPSFYHLCTSPFDIRDELMRLIDEEIECQRQNGTGHIIAKMNSMTDKKLMMKLYEASRAGVKIELIVRGICCLRPEMKNVSETITVRSIVGRFLEHERIFYFHHNHKEKVFISSADWMTRNMENRVEIMFPIYADHLKTRIKEFLSVMLKDNVKAREQGADGKYRYVSPKKGEPRINSQQVFCIQAYEAGKDN
ncbi:RNA degradosome polyphosphate kinase [Aneurinibacillus uraniidurans]|uniref:RNA degradosome polyphosphate kinase n=1 Tax=Aneurinibacillus uraniidurans TaxID=2966586 RepID=UPI00234B80D7|nr:RNA degradosome polyphosphate kinase [Aneurinibacillus sp. B1]WCN36572.1 RNA degradosome polyphosphate kinase [Aneurinibacillus sp. B1]